MDRAKSSTSTSLSEVLAKIELKEITRHLIQVLRETEKSKLRYFKNHIDNSDGPDALYNALLECIHLEIRGLEGKQLTHQMFENIRRKQEAEGKICGVVGGYLEYLTDDRDNNYCRFYVGQSTNMPSRICGYAVALMSRSVASLHYYICSLGKGSRKSHFLELFRLPETEIPSNSGSA